MKLKDFKQAMDWRRRVGFNGGGYVKKKVLPQPKPKEEAEKVNKARKEKTFEKAKGALENPKEVKEMIDKPKRGLVDEPGSYSITAKEQKNIDAWSKRFKSAIDKGLTKPYEELTKSQQYLVRQGKNVGFPREPVGKFKFKQVNQSGTYYVDSDPLSKVQRKNVTAWEKKNKKNFDDVTDLNVRNAIKTKGAKYITRPEIQEKGKILKDSKTEKRAIELLNQGNDKVTVANKLEAEGLIKIKKFFDISKGKKTKNYSAINREFNNLLKDGKLSIDEIAKTPIGGKLGALEEAARDKKILETIAENPDLNPEQIAKRLNLSGSSVVTRIANKNKIVLKSYYDQLAPEVKELDKLIKQNVKFLTGDSNLIEKRKVLLDGMKKRFGPNYSVGQLQTKLYTIGNQYLGNLNVKAYQDIKAPKNYKNSALHNNIVGLAKTDYLGVVSEAKILGLPKKDIELLEDVLGGSRKLTKMKVAGDHTDINSLMKNFPEYKKNFTRINIISNRLNQEKLQADMKLINLVRKLNNKEITPQEFTTQVEGIRTDFMNKTKVKIGNPVTDARGNVSLDFQTDRLIDLKNPRNKAISQAVTNLIEQEGVKFSDFDTQYSQANTVKERFNLLKNATTEALQKSKIIKGFAEMSGNVGEAAKNILKTKTGKVGAAGLLYTLATAAGPRPTETDLVDEVALTRGAAESLPTKTAAGAGLAAATAGTKTGRDLFSKGFKGFDRFLLRPLTAIEAPAAAVPQSAFQAGKLIGDVKRGEQTDVKGMDITLPTSLSSLAASKKFGLDLFADNAGRLKRFLRAGFTQPALRTLSRGSVFATPIIETGIQGYNAMKALQDARRNASAFEPRVDTALGEAPISYYNRIMSELPEVDRSGAAGGGIMKMAGKSSGPAPESGPTPQGLDFLMKRGR